MTEPSRPTTCDLLILGGIVLTLDHERRILWDGAIAVAGNRILEVGRRADLAPRYQAQKVINGQGRVITPGLSRPTSTSRPSNA